MVKNIKKVGLLVATIMLAMSAQAQQSIWKSVSESRAASSELVQRNATPSDYQLFQLDMDALKSTLADAPARSTWTTSTATIKLPGQDGELQSFTLYETSTLNESLRLRYPGIASYVAQGVDDKSAVAHLSVGTDGVYAMITSSKHATIYIDPYTTNGRYSIQYSRNDMPNAVDQAVCLVEESFGPAPFDEEELENLRNADDGMLRTFRLALACTGEYAQFHLNNQGVSSGASDAVKKAAVLSAMNTAMTRVNGVFENDLNLTMEIIPNNDELIFLIASSDPYTNNDGGTMLNQNQSTCNSIIGSANYDIGHVFSTGGGGIAQLNSPCTGGKARGVTGLPQPINDQFYIDFVAHEMGHQYGGNHTQNNNCQRSGTSVEVGSGSSIMGYAGICSPNVQNNSDDYFNGANILEMWNNISSGNSTCAAQSNTNNTAPVVNAGADYVIPQSTPFILTGIASDVDGDAITYCWEQRDTATAPMPPQASSNGGPAFRSLDPVASPSRYFPALNTVLNGQLGSTWERLASVQRIYRFRLTVRDNVAGGGQSQSDINVVTVNGATGPFAITSQNTNGIVWNTQTTEEITWDVAGTDAAPINTAAVDILFSTDGGQTFDTVIALATPNDGSETINVPSVNTVDGRIMIRAVDNVYYDINNRDVSVQGTLSTTDVELADLSVWPNPTDGQFNVSFTADSGSDVAIEMYDVRGRLVNTTTYSNVGTAFNQNLDYRNLTSGMYFVTIYNGSQKTTKKLTIR